MTMTKIYLRILKIIWRIYGVNKVFIQWLLIEPLLRGFVFFTLFLDKLFFSGYKNVEVKRPIFILGHPRSGTTFLHKLLGYSEQTVVFTAWQLMFPALTARILLRPLYNILCKKGLTEVFPKETGHKIDLREAEEEEMLFLNNYDTQFMAAGLLGFDEQEYPELQWHDHQPDAHRFRSTNFLRDCFKRQIFATGKQKIIAQTHFSTHRIKTLMEAFPDAKFIYVVRDPHQVVPSFLSLLYKTIDLRWGLKPVPQTVLDRYYRRRYQAMIDLYRYFYELQKNNELPEERVLVLPYTQLLTDLQGAVENIIRFTGIQANEVMLEKVADQARRQKDYKPEHKGLPLEMFGITRQEIDKDFAFVFDNYDIPTWDKRQD